MSVEDWKPCDAPNLAATRGRYVHVTPLSIERDVDSLFRAIGGPANDELWRFIPFGPLKSADALGAVLGGLTGSGAWLTHLIRHNETDEVLGMASYMRLRPEVGSAEVGGIVYSRALMRTPAATEAMYIMARHLFDDLGYRRYEWKCDHANAASRRAAERLGFTFEGIFRQDLVVKGLNRDTAWFSMLDGEWPAIRSAFERWLAHENLGADGQQRRSLADFRAG